jgi:DNA-binding response OmpR family regulator
VIVVAAEDEIVTAFAAGADDVVTPRVDAKELAARLDAILRRRRFTG